MGAKKSVADCQSAFPFAYAGRRFSVSPSRRASRAVGLRRRHVGRSGDVYGLRQLGSACSRSLGIVGGGVPFSFPKVLCNDSQDPDPELRRLFVGIRFDAFRRPKVWLRSDLPRSPGGAIWILVGGDLQGCCAVNTRRVYLFGVRRRGDRSPRIRPRDGARTILGNLSESVFPYLRKVDMRL